MAAPRSLPESPAERVAHLGALNLHTWPWAMQPAVKETSLTLFDFCAVAWQKIKLSAPVHVRSLFERPVGKDIVEKFLEYTRVHIAGQQTVPFTFKILREFMGDTLDSSVEFIEILEGHSSFNNPRYVHVGYEYSLDQKTSTHMPTTKRLHGYKVSDLDKKLVKAILVEKSPDGKMPLLEWLFGNALPEFVNPPKDSVIQNAYEARVQVARIIDMEWAKGTKRRKTRVEMARDISEILLAEWFSLSFPTPGSDVARIKSALEGTGITSIYETPVDEIFEKVMAPAHGDRNEAEKRMIVLEEIIMHGVANLNTEIVQRVSRELSDILDANNIPNCEAPTAGLVNATVLAHTAPLHIVREEMRIPAAN